jgi:hypothetical protein
MNSNDSERWQSEVLHEILKALAASEALKGVLIYKGALILQRRLNSRRISLDIDSNLSEHFIVNFPNKEDEEKQLNAFLKSAIQSYFLSQDPVRFELEYVKMKRSPPKNHPFGWDAFSVKVKVKDNENLHVINLSSLSIDIAAPELLSGNSTSPLNIGEHNIRAYTLERIAGEKLRAYLSTLPAYRNKVGKIGEAIRTKDLYDIALIYRKKPIVDYDFWLACGREFKLACSSRFIDCLGVDTFRENWNNVERLFGQDPTLPKDISFREVETALMAIIAFFDAENIVPFSFPLPTE